MQLEPRRADRAPRVPQPCSEGPGLGADRNAAPRRRRRGPARRSRRRRRSRLRRGAAGATLSEKRAGNRARFHSRAAVRRPAVQRPPRETEQESSPAPVVRAVTPRTSRRAAARRARREATGASSRAACHRRRTAANQRRRAPSALRCAKPQRYQHALWPDVQLETGAGDPRGGLADRLDAEPSAEFSHGAESEGLSARRERAAVQRSERGGEIAPEPSARGRGIPRGGRGRRGEPEAGFAHFQDCAGRAARHRARLEQHQHDGEQRGHFE